MSQAEFYLILNSIVKMYASHRILQRRFKAQLKRLVTIWEPGEAISTPGLVIMFLGDEIAADANRQSKVFITAIADNIIKENADLFLDEWYENKFRRLPSFVERVGEEIFNGRPNLGRVAAFLAFGGSLSAYCEQRDDLGLQAVETIVKTVAKYLDDNLGSYWESNGGLVRNMRHNLHDVTSLCPELILLESLRSIPLKKG